MKRFINPNFIYTLTFIIPFLVYSLGWSTIYPELTPELYGFYIATFVIAIVTGILIDKLPRYVYKPIPVYKYNVVVMVCLYLMYGLDFLYTGFVPLFAYSSGEANFRQFTIGIPTVHVILVTFTIFFSLYLFHQYLSNKKRSLLVLYIISFGQFVLLLERSSIMYIFIGSVFIFFMSQKQILLKRVIRLLVLSLFILYMFGYLGNLRSFQGNSKVIPNMSGVTSEFMEGPIPNEYYWAYLYMGSPLANLQNNINSETDVKPDYGALIVFEMIPDFVAKRIADFLMITPREFHQINSWLNVGTIYASSFSYVSWNGMILMFCYLMLLMNLYHWLMIRSSRYGTVGLAMMFCVISLGNFSNSMSFSAFSFPLFYPFLLSIIKGSRKKYFKVRASFASN